MIISRKNSLPFLVNQDEQSSKEGDFVLYFYSRKIIHKNEVKYKYEPLRFDGIVARFKTQDDASAYAKYRLALDC